MKQIRKKYRKAKGFTLVELLIVIIIIGILSGMMMLSTGAATDKAEATKILSNMRNIKAATIMYYSDNNQWPTSVTVGGYSSFDKYLDSVPTGASYDVTAGGADAGYKARITATSIDVKVGEKLKGLKDSTGISVNETGDTATLDIK